MSRDRGKVYLVGAGPGDPELITVRGLRLLRQADVVLYDRLAPKELLSWTKPGAAVLPVGKAPGGDVSQEQINKLLVEHARAGRVVVRLKGGDPFVFGRGFEELAACRDAGIECEVVPGVSSAMAGPMAAGVPVTHRGEAQSVAIVTAAGASGEQVDHDFAALARMDTVVVMMGRQGLRKFCTSLQSAGRDADTPAACIERATTNQQRVVSGTLSTIAGKADQTELVAPVVTIIGPTARHAMSRSLAGRRVWLTRPRSSAETMRRTLEAHGASVVEEPLIRIEYPKNHGQLAEVPERIDQYDWVVVTSVHGVSAIVNWLHQRRPGRRLRAKVAAVGPATAAALTEAGLPLYLVPEIHTGAALADALAAWKPKPRHVLYPRSSLASGTLVERLRGTGIMVDDVVAYHTVEVDASDVQMAAARDADVVVLCSPSAARAYARVLLRERIPASEGARRDTGASTRVVCCIGPVTEDAAKTCGLDVQVVADRHTSEGVVEALVRYYAAGELHSRERIPAEVGARNDSRTSENSRTSEPGD